MVGLIGQHLLIESCGGLRVIRKCCLLTTVLQRGCSLPCQLIGAVCSKSGWLLPEALRLGWRILTSVCLVKIQPHSSLKYGILSGRPLPYGFLEVHTLEIRHFPPSTHFGKPCLQDQIEHIVPVCQPYSTARGYDLQGIRYRFCSCFLHRTLIDHLIRASLHLSGDPYGCFDRCRPSQVILRGDRILFTPSSSPVSPEPNVRRKRSHVRTGVGRVSKLGK